MPTASHNIDWQILFGFTGIPKSFAKFDNLKEREDLASIFLAAINFVLLILLTPEWHIWHS